jgi:hypothetical protein
MPHKNDSGLPAPEQAKLTAKAVLVLELKNQAKGLAQTGKQ